MRNPEDQRQNLAQAILNVRSQRATSRRTLADVMRLSPTTAGFYVDQLIESGHLRESGLEQGLMGRPKRTLGTVAEAGWFAGIEFNAERVQGVRVDFSGKLSRTESQPLTEGASRAEVMTEIKNLIIALSRGGSGPLLSIGLGAPGVVDPLHGIGVEYAFMPDWQNVPVVDQLGKRFKKPVLLENNLRTIALAERWFGGAQEMADYVILGPRIGFGIAIVHQGRLMGGAHHAAGEIGHWPWPDRSNTKLHDCLSAPAIWRRLAGVTSRARIPTDLRAALAEHADTTSAAWADVVQDFAQVMTRLQLLLDTQTYFLHGPLTALEEPFCRAIEAATIHSFSPMASRQLMLIPSTLNDDAGALGAASLAMEAWRP
ncbi:MAG: ROK family protein [Prosthecobacter sp.]